MFKLPKTRKAQWLKDLRSGEFRQDDGGLCTTDGKGKAVGYCCLGVYVHDRLEATNGKHYVVFRGDSAFLPRYMIPKYIQKILAQMNDSGASFDEIADWIEENL